MKLLEMAQAVKIEIQGQVVMPRDLNPSIAAADIQHGHILVNGQRVLNVDLHISGVNHTENGVAFVITVRGTVRGGRDIESLKHAVVTVSDHKVAVSALNVIPQLASTV